MFWASYSLLIVPILKIFSSLHEGTFEHNYCRCTLSYSKTEHHLLYILLNSRYLWIWNSPNCEYVATVPDHQHLGLSNRMYTFPLNRNGIRWFTFPYFQITKYRVTIVNKPKDYQLIASICEYITGNWTSHINVIVSGSEARIIIVLIIIAMKFA